MARVVTATLLAIAALALLATAHAQPLHLDPTFGADGVVVPQPTGARGLSDAVIPPSAATQGRTYVSGETAGPNGAPYVLALMEHGTPDPSFGTGGVVLVDDTEVISGRFFGLALGADGTVYAAGTASVADGNGDGFRDTRGLIAGYDATGAPTFTGGYTLVDDAGDQNFVFFTDVAASGDGACAAGRSLQGTDDALAVACVDASGALRSDFGLDGLALVAGPPEAPSLQAAAIATDAEGRLLLAGNATDFVSSYALVARLLPDGTPDPAFDGDGLAIGQPLSLSYPSYLDVIPLADGRVFAVGAGRKKSESGALGTLFDASGAPDPTYGFDGSVWVDGPEGVVGTAVAAEQRGDGTLRILARANEFPRGGPPNVAIIGTDAEGELLSAVGEGGIQLLGGGDETFFISDAAFDGDTRLVVAGNEAIGISLGGLVARYAEASGDIGATLTPLGPTAFPAEGGMLRYDATLRNDGDAAVSLQAWVEVTLPDGMEILVLQPKSVTLAPGQEGTRSYRLDVAPEAPGGAYTLTLYAGTFPDKVVAVDAVSLTKEAPVGLKAAAPGAALSVTEVTAGPLAVYPNPTAGPAWATPVAAAGESVRIRVLDALGREASRLDATGGAPVALPTESLAPGAYTVVIETSRGDRETARLTIVR